MHIINHSVLHCKQGLCVIQKSSMLVYCKSTDALTFSISRVRCFVRRVRDRRRASADTVKTAYFGSFLSRSRLPCKLQRRKKCKVSHDFKHKFITPVWLYDIEEEQKEASAGSRDWTVYTMSVTRARCAEDSKHIRPLFGSIKTTRLRSRRNKL